MEYKKQQQQVEVKPQIKSQRVVFNSKGELNVFTHNGKMDAKGNSEVVLDGIFTIHAKDLAKILSELTDVRFIETTCFLDNSVIRFFNPEKTVLQLAEAQKQLQVQENKNDTLVRVINNYKMAINAFNKSRRPWEREFKLPKIEE